MASCDAGRGFRADQARSGETAEVPEADCRSHHKTRSLPGSLSLGVCMFDLAGKRWLIGLSLWALIGLAASSPANGQIRWRNDPARGKTADAAIAPRETLSLAEALSDCSGGHVVVHFDRPVRDPERSALKEAGVELLSSLGQGAFFASVTSDPDEAALARIGALKRIEAIQTAWKQHPLFSLGDPPASSIVRASTGDDPIVAAYVLFHADVPLVPDGVTTARRHGAVVRSHLRSVNGLVIELPFSGVETLAGEDSVQWIEPPLPPFASLNNDIRLVTQIETVQTDPHYALDGSGVSVLVYDGGTADEGHPDFGGRLTARDTAPISTHSTHVAGTIGGDGYASSGTWRGMAPGVTIESYGFEVPGGPNDGFLYSNPGDLEQDYDEAINVFSVDLANNSIGSKVCDNGHDCAWTGDYGVTSQLIDAIIVGSLTRRVSIIWAAGNERGCDRCRDEGVTTPEGFRSIAPPAGAKNHIAVGAVNSNDESVTPFTSWGPTDDGRLKPDLVAPGCQVGGDYGVTSSSAMGGYFALCGTSMAAPAVTGAAALVLEEYRSLLPSAGDPRNATLKALLAHSARDLGPPGPDFMTGFGAIRVKDTIDFMRTGNFVEGRINNALAETQSLVVRVDSDSPSLKVTLAWDDLPGTPNVLPALVNDLDLRVYDRMGALHLPWTLDPNNPAAPAERSRADHVNNMEQVVVESPAAGLWLIQVLGHDLPGERQAFSLCTSADIPIDCDENGIPDVDELLASPDLDCTGNGILDICEPDCDRDGIADSCELAQGTSSDCNANGTPDDCEAWADCNKNDTYDPCDISEGYAADCNANWVPDSCEQDCNNNDIADECDITSGYSEDCDQDGTPDECQPITDCNLNSISDPCEIMDGLVEDRDHNGVPDECEVAGDAFYVDVANCPGPGTGELEDPFCRIQDAIGHTIPGDEVIVVPGTYSGPGNRDIDFAGRGITLRSTVPDDPAVVESTIIDCESKGRGLYFHSGETRHALVDGLTIRNGLASVGSTPGSTRGAGIFCKNSSPTIRNCVITQCLTGSALPYHYGGGGLFCLSSSPLIDNCTISANFSYNYGGGVYAYEDSHLVLRGCTITDNVSFGGGGVACGLDSHVNITNCTIAYNTAGIGGLGGALALYASSEAHVTSSAFLRNTAGSAGGTIHATYGSLLTIHDSTIAGNFAEGVPSVILVGGSVGTLANTILWDDADVAQLLVGQSSDVTVAYSNVWGGEQAILLDPQGTLNWGQGNIDLEPMFADDDTDDYSLTDDSPCVDAGDPQFPDLSKELDIDGERRVQNCRIDIGADETPFFSDCNANSIADACETADGMVEDCNNDAVPDECQDTTADCNENGVWDMCDIAEGVSVDCNDSGIPDDCEIADGTVPDCNGNAVPDSCDIADETSEDLNENGVPDECEECENDSDCTDGLFCTGVERCQGGVCLPGQDPCPHQVCVEEEELCYDCVTDAHCDDGNICTINTCDDDYCLLEYATGPCDDGEPCTENDVCVEGRCRGTVIPGCGPTVAIRAAEVNGSPLPDGPSGEVSVYPLDVVTCEIFLEAWEPRTLRSFNMTIDPSGYASGLRGSLSPLVDPTPSTGAFIAQDRPDYLFYGLPGLTVVWNAEPTSYQYGGLVLFAQDCVADPGAPAYLATLILDVSLDAVGVFTVCLDDTDSNGDLDPERSFLRDCNTAPVKPIDFECLHITVIADCNRNGIPDDQDIANGTSEDCTGNGIPDECEPDCNENGIADSCDIMDGTSADCNENGIPDSCDIDAGSSDDCDGNNVPDECQPDCNENGVADICDIMDGTSLDCNENGVPDECEDCNGNGFADECDIEEGTSLDCNDNAVPDECDIADGTSHDCDVNGVPDDCQDTSADCNENGIWDYCDIFDGRSGDCNANGQPDECDIDSNYSSDCDRNGLPDECADDFPRVFYAQTLNGVNGFAMHGINEGDYAGRTVAGAGDVNGDGIDDIVIRASWADPHGSEDAGESYVVFGREGPWLPTFNLASLLPYGYQWVRGGFIITGIESDDGAGTSVSSAGDFNGDGFDDLLIGAPGADVEDVEDAGQVYVLFGHPAISATGHVHLSDLDGTNGFAVNGVDENERIGWYTASAGDVNGDGLVDILISAHTATVDDEPFTGRVFVVFGRTEPWPASLDLADLLPQNGGDGTTGFVINGVSGGDVAGSALAGAGDLNDDGYADIVIGAYAADPHDQAYAGQAYVIFGSPTVGDGGEIYLADLDGANGFTINGVDRLDVAGDTVAAAGDINHDGVDDLIVCAVLADPGDQADAGEIYIIFGHGGPWPATFELADLLPEHGGDGSTGSVFNGINRRDYAGFSAAPAGDVNDDGIDDIIIGAYAADVDGLQNAGEAYVLFGHEAPWPPSFELASLLDNTAPDPAPGFTIRGVAEHDSFGRSVAGAGDFNNDGISDIVVGAPDTMVDEVECVGSGYMIFGNHVLPYDCNQNGILDLCDIQYGTSEDCNDDDIPDECQDSGEDCNDNGVWDLCDILQSVSFDCNANDIPDECDLADGFSEDCNENGWPDECDIDDPPDCNDNDVWDECDILHGTSEDCNTNAIPDECEPGSEEDCNENGEPDLCDIHYGVSDDVNANTVPDECEPRHTLYVNVATCDQETGGSGTTVDPFCHIQDAIDSAGTGENEVIEIIVADGVYTGPSNRALNFSANLPEGWTRAVWLHSENGPAACIIDCEGALQAFAFQHGEGPGARVEGFTMVNGNAGAILCKNNSNPTIRNCVITRNLSLSMSGAGVSCVASSPIISHCLIAGNYIAGISCIQQSSPRIDNCAIVGNHGGNGGGLRCVDNSNPTIEHCTIAGNVDFWNGGGIHSDQSMPIVTNSVFWGNLPNDIEGAANVTYSVVEEDRRGTGNIVGDPLFVGGPAGTWTADAQYDPATRLTTLTDDTATWQESEHVGRTVNVATSYEIQFEFVIIANTATTLTVRGSLWDMPTPGGHYRIHDYHLAEGSPCVDGGKFGMWVRLGETDLTGEDRVRHCGIDMGAYESPFFSDCNANALPDACECAEGTADDCDVNGVPDECDPDCNKNDQVDACDIMAGTSRDRNNNGIPDECEAVRCDLNRDGRVDSDDVELIETCLRINRWAIEPYCEPADLNGDHRVTRDDWDIFVPCYRKHRWNGWDPSGGSYDGPPRTLRSEQ